MRRLRHGVCHHAVVAVTRACGGRMSEVPYRVDKPWGYELVWARTDRYVGKILHIEPGHVLSLQYHKEKDESIYVLHGEIILRFQEGDTLIERPLRQGEAFHIQPKVVHQFEAVAASDVLEASTPHIDDVVRLKDRYGRV
jgi:mannose-6-phosphate isomerase